MKFTDLYISPYQFMLIVEKVYAESNLGNMTTPAHPEDVYYQISTIVNNLGLGITHYVDAVKKQESKEDEESP